MFTISKNFSIFPDIAMVIVIGGLLLSYGYNNQNNDTDAAPREADITPLRSTGGGGGGGSSSATTQVTTSITDISICKDKTADHSCDKGMYPDSNFAYLFWRVENGVGCCNTYSCVFDVFKSSCLYPEFKLYSIALDGKMQTIDYNEYDYSCTTDTPWNWFLIKNITAGQHMITVLQQNCHMIVANKSVSFNMTPTNGINILMQLEA